jgi:hypothetical protein
MSQLTVHFEKKKVIGELREYQASRYNYRNDNDFRKYIDNLKTLKALNRDPDPQCENCAGVGYFEDTQNRQSIPCPICNGSGSDPKVFPQF